MCGVGSGSGVLGGRAARQVVTNIAEYPAGRKELVPALPRLQDIQRSTPSSLLERCASQTIRQVMFDYLPYQHLPA